MLSKKSVWGILPLGLYLFLQSPSLWSQTNEDVRVPEATSTLESEYEAKNDPMEEVEAMPLYVAPTRRDRIGRIWAPVYLNGQGPFRLVLDTGASHSALIPSIVEALQMEPDMDNQVYLRGTTGSAVLPTITLDTMDIGDLHLRNSKLPVIATALGGADGILGTQGFEDKRIDIDFTRDLITITESKNRRAGLGFITVPIDFSHNLLLTSDVTMGGVRMKAIFDTGGQVTIGNLAAKRALDSLRNKLPSEDNIIGVTEHIEQGEGYPVPQIKIGDIRISSPRMTFVDLHIFKYWDMIDEPVILIGMDALGLLEQLVIDYKRAELHLKVP